MPIISKNLGQVAGIVHRNTEPTNKKIIWWDETLAVNAPKVYNFNTNQWEIIATGGVTTFLALSDTINSYSGLANQLIKVNSTATAVDTTSISGNNKYYGTDGSGTLGVHDLPSGGGSSTYLGLSDTTDSDYTGKAGFAARVNVGENGLTLAAINESKWTDTASILSPNQGADGLQITSDDDIDSITIFQDNLETLYNTTTQHTFAIDSTDQLYLTDDPFVLIPNASVGIGTLTPTEKLEVFDGNLLINTSTTTGTGQFNPVRIKMHANKWNEDAGVNVLKNYELYFGGIDNPASPGTTRSHFYLQASGSKVFEIDFKHRVVQFGSNTINDVTPNAFYLIGDGNIVQSGNGIVLIGNSMTATGDNIFGTGSGASISENRSNIRFHKFGGGDNTRINFEYGKTLPLRLIPITATSINLQNNNQGINLISSYWNGSANQDTIGYISHFITDQANGESALSLGNLNYQHVLTIDATGAVRIGDAQHSIALTGSPREEGLLVYANPNYSNAIIKTIQPDSAKTNKMAMENDGTGVLELGINGTTSVLGTGANDGYITHTGSGSMFIKTTSNEASEGNIEIISQNGEIRLLPDEKVIIGGTSGNTDALLEMVSTTQGFKPPAMTSVQRDAIATPTSGLLIANITTNSLNYYDGTQWMEISSSPA